jgi:hypothetical protein
MMKKQTEISKIERRHIPSLLARMYMKDYEASIAEFPEDKKNDFLEHLLECLDIIEVYLSSPTKENWKIYAQKENVFLKKHGKRLKVYRQKNMYLYYGDSTLLVEKNIYTTEEWNSLGSEQKLSPEELASFIYLCRNSLYHERDHLYLELSPDDEKEEKNTKENLSGSQNQQTIKRIKVKREAQDKLTCLSQEQTVLLIHYLQQGRVLLKDEYLSNMDAGKAFENLTGYSQNTLRQSLGKIEAHQNKTNLKEVENVLTRIIIAIGKDLKEK